MKWRLLLLPLVPIYAAAVGWRLALYRFGVLKRVGFDLPVIVIGNLTTGGTGKTPMTDFLIRTLKDEFKVGLLSRGYGRRTQGLRLADDLDGAIELGDETSMLRRKHPDISVAVGGRRVMAIPMMLMATPELQAIILDDAFQHMELKAGLYVLLTTWSEPWTRDFLLPAGNLREFRSGASRADAVVVTRCPDDLTDVQWEHFVAQLKIPEKQVFAATLAYGTIRTLHREQMESPGSSWILISALANADAFDQAARERVEVQHHYRFPDHHWFRAGRIQDILDKHPDAQVLTTEKDAERLVTVWPDTAKDFYVLPVQHRFIRGGQVFIDQLVSYVRAHAPEEPWNNEPDPQLN